jgi:glycerol-3-phosphate dehydrogenase
VVFVIPYEGRFSLVGTTDVPHEGDPAHPVCSPEEARYLCDAVARQFRAAPDPRDIVWTYSGVRPLHDDGSDNPSAVTRDYVLRLDPAPGPPLLSVFGGKITTFRRLAEEALGMIGPRLGRRPGSAWTGTAALPGGDFAGGLPALEREIAAHHPWLPAPRLARLIRAYGTEVEALLEGARGPADLGEELGAGLTERELAWLREEEWARSGEDVLWRRTKLGLRLSPAERAALTERLDRMLAAPARPPVAA